LSYAVTISSRDSHNPVQNSPRISLVRQTTFVFALGIDIRVIEIDRHLEMRAKKVKGKQLQGPQQAWSKSFGFLSFGNPSSSWRDF
jgi:hypothetical protein